VAIVALKRFPRVPGTLVAVAAATLVVAALDLDRSAGVKVLGALPQGLPSLVLPTVRLVDVRDVVIGGFASRSSRSPTRASCRARTRRGRAPPSIRTRR
jgi:MFS superfamily sulfate permease-like transporter